jgi:hypothetical protein
LPVAGLDLSAANGQDLRNLPVGLRLEGRAEKRSALLTTGLMRVQTSLLEKKFVQK